MASAQHAVLAGKFNATPDEWKRALNFLQRKLRRRRKMIGSVAEVITLTEARGVDAVEDWAKANGWTLVRPAGAECAILFRVHADFPAGHDPLREEGCAPLSSMPLPSGRRVTATWAKIDLHPRFRPVTFVAPHLPAKVEGASRFQAGRHAVVHLSATQGLRRMARDRNRRIIVAGDFNLNYRRDWVQRWARTAFRNLENAWQHPLPEVGTHGPRLIDWHLSGSGITCGRAKPLRKCAGFDHRPFAVTIEL